MNRPNIGVMMLTGESCFGPFSVAFAFAVATVVFVIVLIRSVAVVVMIVVVLRRLLYRRARSLLHPFVNPTRRTGQQRTAHISIIVATGTVQHSCGRGAGIGNCNRCLRWVVVLLVRTGGDTTPCCVHRVVTHHAILHTKIGDCGIEDQQAARTDQSDNQALCCFVMVSAGKETRTKDTSLLWMGWDDGQTRF
jgi:hypothetical protein